jgi:hypothetical protein
MKDDASLRLDFDVTARGRRQARTTAFFKGCGLLLRAFWTDARRLGAGFTSLPITSSRFIREDLGSSVIARAAARRADAPICGARGAAANGPRPVVKVAVPQSGNREIADRVRRPDPTCFIEHLGGH